MSRRGRKNTRKTKQAARPGVYVITCDGADISKIGITKDVQHRLLNMQSGSPLKLNLFNIYSVEGALAYQIEQECHKELWSHHSHGEWFKVNGRTAWRCVQRVGDRLSLSPLSPPRDAKPLLSPTRNLNQRIIELKKKLYPDNPKLWTAKALSLPHSDAVIAS